MVIITNFAASHCSPHKFSALEFMGRWDNSIIWYHADSKSYNISVVAVLQYTMSVLLNFHYDSEKKFWKNYDFCPFLCSTKKFGENFYLEHVTSFLSTVFNQIISFLANEKIHKSPFKKQVSIAILFWFKPNN